MKNSREVHSWQEDVAVQRFQLISDLLDEGLAPREKGSLRKEIAENSGLSERTLRRYEERYRLEGFNGLKPADRTIRKVKGRPDNFEEIMEQAVQLKKENPGRSVRKIIFILEVEGWCEKGVLKRSTISRHLVKRGLSSKAMKKYAEDRKSTDAQANRYCPPHRMMTLQADIRDGIYLPIGKNGKKIETHLAVVIDHHSRYVLFARWFLSETAEVVAESLRESFLRYGLPVKCVFDNGPGYRAKDVKDALSRLGVKVTYCKPYHPATKGVVERFNNTCESIDAELRMHHVTTLEELNTYFAAWLEEEYQNYPHEGIREYYECRGVKIPKEGITPFQEWDRDTRPLNPADAAVIAEAFLRHERRSVDGTGVFSLKGRKFTAGTELRGQKVEVIYDPKDLTNVKVAYSDWKPFPVKPTTIDEHCEKPVPLECLGEPEESRYLNALMKKHNERKAALAADVLSFSSYTSEEDD